MLTSRWILFADADTRYEPGFLDAVVSAAEAGRVDFLSMYLQPEYRTAAESSWRPYAVALYFFGLRPRTDPAAAFNGQCVLVRRDAYEFVGGHGALLNTLNRRPENGAARAAASDEIRGGARAAARQGPSESRVDFERQCARFALTSSADRSRPSCSPRWSPPCGCRCWWAWRSSARRASRRHSCFLPAPFLFPGTGGSGPCWRPLGIYGMLPILLRGALGAVTRRRLEWKGRVIVKARLLNARRRLRSRSPASLAASIAILDDDADFRNYLEDFLNDEGLYAVRAFASAGDLFQGCAENLPDIVLLDMKMGDASGDKVLEYLIARWPGLCVIIITGYPSLEDMRTTFKLKVFDYLAKPFSLAQLRLVLKNAVAAYGLGKSPQDRLRERLGHSIKMLRVERDWSLKDLATQTKLSVSQISAIERGTNLPSIESLLAISRAFDKKPSEILQGIDF